MKKLFQKDKIGAELTDEQKDHMAKLGGLLYDPRDIALYFRFDAQQFTFEYNDADSIISEIINSGRMKVSAAIDMKMFDNAISGDLQAAQQVYKVRREKSFQLSKLDCFGGFDSKESFEKIYEYISTGSSSTLADNEQQFLDLLVLINTLDHQFGKRNTIKLLTKDPFLFTYAQASDLFSQAENLFYSNKNATKESLRNKYAESLLDWAKTVAKTANCAKDYEIAGNLTMQATKILRLDQPDAEKLPISQYIKPIRLSSLDSADVGLPAANRDELSRQIDSILAPDAVKKRLRMEAGIEDVDFIEVVSNGIQEED